MNGHVNMAPAGGELLPMECVVPVDSALLQKCQHKHKRNQHWKRTFVAKKEKKAEKLKKKEKWLANLGKLVDSNNVVKAKPEMNYEAGEPGMWSCWRCTKLNKTLDGEVVDVCDTCENSNPMRQVKAAATAHMEEVELCDLELKEFLGRADEKF